MNKQELIRKYEELWKEHSPFHEPVPYTSMVELFLKELKQLDEPQPVKIPQFVADKIEYARKYDYNILDAMMMTERDDDFYNWLWADDNMELFARAWLDGYEVEEEKRYLVKIKNLKALFCYLAHSEHGDYWSFTCSKMNGFSTKHTRKELEEAGFGEVFNSPLFEVEEVTE